MTRRRNLLISDGKVADMASDDVQKVMEDSVMHGDLLCAVLRTPDGHIAVQMMLDPSSREASRMPDILEEAARALRVAQKSLLE